MMIGRLRALVALCGVALLATPAEAQNIGVGGQDTPAAFAFPVLRFFRPEFFLAGSQGTALRYDASDDSWTNISIAGEPRELMAVHGTSRRNVWLGTFHQTAEDLRIYRWNGNMWTARPVTNAVLPQVAINGRPRPGGIWSFGGVNTYASVVAQQDLTSWWLVNWNGIDWTLLQSVDGGRASGGVFGVRPGEIYFVGEATGSGAGLWRWNGATVEQLPAGFGLPTGGTLNGVAKGGDSLFVSGISSSGRQAIWRGTFDTSFQLEFEATHDNRPLSGRANNWCVTYGREVRVIGVDSSNRSTLYERNQDGIWSPDPEIAAQAPCGDAVQAAFSPGATLITLRSCTQGGDDVQVLNLSGSGWSLENPPGNHSWNAVWATTATTLLVSPSVFFLQGLISDALVFPPK